MPKSDVQQVVFEVEKSWRLPDLAPIVPNGGEVRDVSDRGSSTYFDTTTGRLRSLGLTLERRQNDDGVSWFLVLPAGGVQASLQSRARSHSVPRALARQLAGVLAGDELVEVASVSTSRATHRVLASDGELVVEISDDQLQGATLGAETQLSEWREVEIRPGSPADRGVFAGLRKSVRKSGAVRRDDDLSALDRLLGRSERVSPDHKLTRLVGTYVSTQCAEILLSDVALRDHSDVASVHRMRVAIRRLRSVLKAFAGLMHPDTSTFADDVRWVALQLGAIRDLDVLDARILDAVNALPDVDLIGPVARHLSETLNARRVRAYDDWQHAWDDERYQRVMATAARWHLEPPVSSGARLSAKKVLARSTKRVNVHLAAAGDDPERLHDARKAAKRLRYVAEVLTPEAGSAVGVGKRAKRLQTQLGEHQDAISAAALLDEQGRAAGARADDNGFSYGLLLAEQRQLAAQALKGLPTRI